MKWLVLGALFGIILNQGVFVLGVSYTSPINASIVTTTLPIIAMIISAFYLKEPVTWKKIGGIVVGATGAIVIILNSSSGKTFGELGMKGILLCFLAQFSYAIYFVFFKKIISRYHSITIMKWMFLFSSFIYLPLTWSNITTIDYANMPVSVIGQIGFIVLGSTFFSYMMIPIAQKYLRPTVATMYNNVQPVVAAVAAVFMQIDNFGWPKVFAILLVFSGVYLVTTSKAKEDIAEDKAD
nr:DMT family transporter [uncultured Carboxylicivirga sp.]